jgi:serine/threonine-protein kinase
LAAGAKGIDLPAAPSSKKREKGQAHAYVGKVISEKYRVLNALGEGGCGTVLLVENVTGMVDKKLALKILPAELSSTPAFEEQFKQEISVAMRLVDKHIVQIRDVGTTGEGLPYYTMDYCPGETLAQVLKKEGRLPVSRSVAIVLRVLRGLQTAHAEGIIHRDLKPSNLMIERHAGKDAVKILDLGIATAVNSQGGRGGTPTYMAPEQFVGERISFATDLYALGVILYECITGRKPHQGSSKKEILESLGARAPPRPEELAPEVDEYPGLSNLVMKALERNPQRRFQSARELFDALGAILSPGAAQGPGSAAAPVHRQAPLKLRGAAESGLRQAAPRRRPVQKSSSPGWIVTLGVVVALILAAGVYVWIEKRSPKAKEEPAAVVKPAFKPGPVPIAPVLETESLQPAEPAKPESNEEIRDTASEAEDWFRKGKKEFENGDHAKAADSLGKAGGLWPADKPKKDVVLLRAMALLKLKKLDTAAGLVDDVLRNDPYKQDPEANDLKAQALEEQGNEGETRAFVKRAHDDRIKAPNIDRLYQRYFVDEPKELKDKAIELLTSARQALDKKDYPEAAKKAREAFEKWRSADAFLVAANSYFQLNDVAAGLDVCEKALSPPRPEGSSDAVDAIKARYAFFKGKKLLLDYEAQGPDKASAQLLSQAETSLKDGAARTANLPKDLQGDVLQFTRLGLAQALAFRDRPDLAIDGQDGARTIQKEPGDEGPYLLLEECRTLLLAGARSRDQEARRVAYRVAKGRINGLLGLTGLSRELRGEGQFLNALCLEELKSAEAADAMKKSAENGFKSGKGYTYRQVTPAPLQLPRNGFARRLRESATQETEAGAIHARVSLIPDALIYSMALEMESLDVQRLAEEKTRQSLKASYKNNKSLKAKPFVLVSLSMDPLKSEPNTHYLFRESLDNHVVLKGGGLQKGLVRSVSPALQFKLWKVRVTSGRIDNIGLCLFPGQGVSFEFASTRELKPAAKDPITVVFTKIICQTRRSDPKNSINPDKTEITFNDWNDVYVKNATVTFAPARLKPPPLPDRFELILWTLENA